MSRTGVRSAKAALFQWVKVPPGHRSIHVLPSGFHRIRHYGLFANGGRAENLARARQLLAMPTPDSELGDGQTADPDEPPISALACSCCGGRMIVIETFEPGHPPRAPPQAKADRP